MDDKDTSNDWIDKLKVGDRILIPTFGLLEPITAVIVEKAWVLYYEDETCENDFVTKADLVDWQCKLLKKKR